MFPPEGTDVKVQEEPESSRLIPQAISVQVATYSGQQPVILSICSPTQPDGTPTLYVLNSTDLSVLEQSNAIECFGAQKDIAKGPYGNVKKMIAENINQVDLRPNEIFSTLQEIEFTEFSDVVKDAQVVVKGKLATLSAFKSEQGKDLIVGALAHPTEPRSLKLLMFGNINDLTYPAELVRGREVIVCGAGGVDMDGEMKVIVGKVGLGLLRDEHQEVANAGFVDRYLNVVTREKMRPYLRLDAGKDVLKRLISVASTLKKHTRSECDLILDSPDGQVLIDSYEHWMEFCSHYIPNGMVCFACRYSHWLSLEFGGQCVKGCVLNAHVIGGTTVSIFVAFDVLVKLCRLSNLPLIDVNTMLSQEQLDLIAKVFKSSVRCRAIVGARVWVIKEKKGVNRMLELIDVVSVAAEDRYVPPDAADAGNGNVVPDANSSGEVVTAPPAAGEEGSFDDEKKVVDVEDLSNGADNEMAQIAASYAAKVTANKMIVDEMIVSTETVDEDGDFTVEDVVVRPRRSKRKLDVSEEEKKKEEVIRPRKKARRGKK